MTTPHRRADATRSRTAILDAAMRLLDDQPAVGLEAIAAAAGVTRQTVYAHFRSRDDLLAAVVEHLTAQAVAAMDATEPDEGPAADALLRLLDAGQQATARRPALTRLIAALPVEPGQDRARHAPVEDRLARVIRRGRRTGEFDRRLPVDWLVGVVVTLGHAAYEHVESGRLSRPRARRALRTTLLRVLGPETPPPPRDPVG